MERAVRFRFGPFVLDLEAAELRNGTQPVPLRPKCFDLLVYLIDHRGKLVTKQQLLEEIWSDAVVSEATLSRTVASLRATLGDDSAEPKYIDTVSRRGYKFIGDVEELGGASSPAADATPFILVRGSKEYPLRMGAQVIGRGRDVHVALYTSTTSRHHARIEVSGDEVTLEDLESRHGTYVNQQRISSKMRLEPGDEIIIGGERLVLWSPGSQTSPEPPHH
jgi:DNA-binding winged helix-turn-helix (wHTH) protein